ncbi:histidine kinase [Leucobacter insecticola]|uniref:histidine kinase n=2 Tax=Leucobacter insecticola TaxID=2714934 RepID=A0A6G8FM99_9MICO|nr:histidine kinase [Leucobacter insecticola]
MMSVVGFESPTVGTVILALMIAAAVFVTVWTLLRTRAQRRRYEEELASWAGERATQAERLRIAADLHDLVSHGLGLITVRAAAARGVTASHGDDERALALADIERVSRETTTELRRMLTVLRDPGAAPLRPGDTLNDLPEIVRTACAAGLTAELDVAELGELSSGVQLTICAVVREGLANTLRHAGPAHAQVEVRRDGATIAVEIRDSGAAGGWQSRPGAGHGLDGLRERVGALGGSLHAAPHEHGFQILARVPEKEYL